MGDEIKKVSEEEFVQAIEQGLVLVDFHADWCGPCRMLAPVLEKVAKNVQGKARVIKIDIDQSQKVASDFRITSVPTLILFNNGSEVGRLVGLRDAETIVDFIHAAHKS